MFSSDPYTDEGLKALRKLFRHHKKLEHIKIRVSMVGLIQTMREDVRRLLLRLFYFIQTRARIYTIRMETSVSGMEIGVISAKRLSIT